MSNIVTSLLRSRSLGIGLTGKSIMLFMGDLASDDGSGIWASKARIARELETTDRTIQRTIEKLVEGGFVRETGHRKHRNGFTVEYKIDVDLVAQCPLSKPEPPTECQVSAQDVDRKAQHMTHDTPSPPTHRHPTPDTPSPHWATHRHPNPNRTILEPQEPLVVPQAEKPEAVSESEADGIKRVLGVYADRDAVLSFVAFRKKLRKPLTLTAAKRLGTQLKAILDGGGDPSDALGMAEEKGWQSINSKWYFREIQNDQQSPRYTSRNKGPSRQGGDRRLDRIARLAGVSQAQGGFDG